MRTYEIEIKSLLGNRENADELKRKLADADPSTKLVSKSEQLNHYFTGGDVGKLYEKVAPLLSSRESAGKLKDIISEGRDFSVRTRESDGKILLVVKASIDDTTSSNGISRIEFEEAADCNALNELDEAVLGAGFEYQAKWSREREEYECRDITVSIDKNAGYGYLAEFEKVINDEGEAEDARKSLRALMNEVGAPELAQDRLERMFAYYNSNWKDYYGTDKVFIVE